MLEIIINVHSNFAININAFVKVIERVQASIGYKQLIPLEGDILQQIKYIFSFVKYK